MSSSSPLLAWTSSAKIHLPPPPDHPLHDRLDFVPFDPDMDDALRAGPWCNSLHNDFMLHAAMGAGFDPVLAATLNTSRWQNAPPIELVLAPRRPVPGSLRLCGTATMVLHETTGGTMRIVGSHPVPLCKDPIPPSGGTVAITPTRVDSIKKQGKHRGKRPPDGRRCMWAVTVSIESWHYDGDESSSDFPELLELLGSPPGPSLDLSNVGVLPAGAPLELTFETAEFQWLDQKGRTRANGTASKQAGRQGHSRQGGAHMNCDKN